uniref:Uncharacterized protein n=3 Tax=Aegilops tauschii subsp. strangulata TaxID=200361 RepID=A0A452ZU90_AEGTS
GGGEMSRFLQPHLQTITDTLQMMSEAAPGGLERTEWSEVVALGDVVSRQATVAGMVWSGDLPGVETLKENIAAYFNVLQGFLLACHGSTVGAGPTLHKYITSSAKGVVDASFSLFKLAVSAYVTGTVWEACLALKKVPATNCIAIGRAMTLICVCLKDILREMKELPLGDDTKAEKSSNGDVAMSFSDKDESFSDLEEDEGFTEEEIAVAKLIIAVTADSLDAVKETIRFVTSLLKSSGNQSGAAEDKVESMENLLSHCRDVADQVNELGASVYAQDLSEMKSAIKRLYVGITGMCQEIAGLGGSPKNAYAAFSGFEKSLKALEEEIGEDVVDEMKNLTISPS